MERKSFQPGLIALPQAQMRALLDPPLGEAERGIPAQTISK